MSESRKQKLKADIIFYVDKLQDMFVENNYTAEEVGKFLFALTVVILCVATESIKSKARRKNYLEDFLTCFTKELSKEIKNA